jgi:hypothetical protein
MSEHPKVVYCIFTQTVVWASLHVQYSMWAAQAAVWTTYYKILLYMYMSSLSRSMSIKADIQYD